MTIASLELAYTKVDREGISSKIKNSESNSKSK